MAQREHYIDRLRTVMTVVVLSAHVSMTYGGSGDWFYREVPVSRSLSSILFTLFTGIQQTYLMGLFFLIAGYFTPPSLHRKGFGHFLLGRTLRLAIPLLVFGALIGPLTIVMVEMCTTPGPHSLWPTFLEVWQQDGFTNGPLWFAQALLIFSIGYCIWRLIATRLHSNRPLHLVQTPAPVPSWRMWLLSALGVGAGAFLLRQPFPLYDRHFGLWLGYFASYIFLFSVGVAAWHFDWLSQLTWRDARPWLIISFLVFPILPAVRARFHGPGVNELFAGGFTWPAALYAFWEPFIAWGLISALLLLFRRFANSPSPLWDWLGRKSYAVYAIHPPVLVAIALWLRKWHASPIAKCGVVTVLGCAASWLIADALLRLPLAKRIL